MPQISVVIPVYNHLTALTKSLQSLRLQTLQPSEVIVVDDGSTDGDVEGAVSQASLGCKVAFIKQANGGASSARNTGFKQATGEFVIFWDADTIARPEMLESLEKALETRPEASYAYCSYTFGLKKMPAEEFNTDSLKNRNYIDTTSLIRRSALLDLPCPFDERLKRFQDWDLWLSLLEKGKIGVFVPEFLFKKLVNGRQGYSSWLPKIIFKLPFTTTKKAAYEAAREIVLTKHGLPK